MPEDEDIEEKWHKDPLGGVFFGLLLIVVACIYFFRERLVEIGPGQDWWPWLIVGIGCVLLLEALIRSTRAEYKRPTLGRAAAGIILIAVGLGFVYGFEDFWSLGIIAVGVIILIYYIRQSV